jgi:phospholipase/carboxylesterase
MLETIEFETGPKPGAAVVVLHGLGADGHDLVPVAEAMNLDPVGDLRFVFPHAPQRPVTLNGGYVMRAWYDIFALGGPRREDEPGLRASLGLIEELLAREKARGIPPARIVLAGFSQGCAMTLLTGLRHAERLAGLAGMSGYLPLASTTAAERSMANAGVPVFLAHGRDDPLVTVDRGRAAHDALVVLGYPVEWHEYAHEHTISLAEIADLNRWLLRVLGRAEPA